MWDLLRLKHFSAVLSAPAGERLLPITALHNAHIYNLRKDDATDFTEILQQNG